MKNNEINEKENISVDAVTEQVSIIDFKMVSFSLAGKDYAIDIMLVKEIAKAGNFTYVPNTSPFVLGVYNLRGDIIPVIDLRLFFNIPTQKREKEKTESMVMISVNDQTFGIVVDTIDKVIGVSKSNIQPPHPIFGDINIKYIQGVIENAGSLYILLDVNKIFNATSGQDEEAIQEVVADIATPDIASSTGKNGVEASGKVLDIKFITDTLATLSKFFVSSVNLDWVENRYLDWRNSRTANAIQLQTTEDAHAFLNPFFSPYTKAFWEDSYAAAFFAVLPSNTSKVINVWNVGCGSGYETYSLAVILRQKYPNAMIRIYANDFDLLSISNAPLLAIPEDQVPVRYRPYLVKSAKGESVSFNQDIKDMILFEYHDCAHQNAIPDVDIIVARDVLSFMNQNLQASMVIEFKDKLKSSGFVLLGKNEVMPKNSGWFRQIEGELTLFSKD